MDADLARDILRSTPFGDLEALGRVQGVTAELVARFRDMAGEMQRMLADDDEGSDLSLNSILMPFVWQMSAAFALAGALAIVLHRCARSAGRKRIPEVVIPGWFRTVLNALATALIGLLAGWLSPGPPGLASLAAVAVLFGLPAASWSLWRTRRLAAAAHTLAVWTVAAVPSAVLIRPWL